MQSSTHVQKGLVQVFITSMILGLHIELGDVVYKNNNVFGYQNMLIVDGSMISANPGVNPSLSITAIAERAMSKISPKQG